MCVTDHVRPGDRRPGQEWSKHCSSVARESGAPRSIGAAVRTADAVPESSDHGRLKDLDDDFCGHVTLAMARMCMVRNSAGNSISR